MLFITGLPGFCPSSGNKGIDQRFGSRRIGRQLIVSDAPTLECRAAWKFEGSYRCAFRKYQVT
jgi:hypothetical protein